MVPLPEAMGKFMDLSLPIPPPQVLCGTFEVIYGKMVKSSPKQLLHYHKYQKADFQDQLRATTPEAMAKNVPLATSHPYYYDFLQTSMTVINLQQML
jgi:hypothetical protein